MTLTEEVRIGRGYRVIFSQIIICFTKIPIPTKIYQNQPQPTKSFFQSSRYLPSLGSFAILVIFYFFCTLLVHWLLTDLLIFFATQKIANSIISRKVCVCYSLFTYIMK